MKPILRWIPALTCALLIVILSNISGGQVKATGVTRIAYYDTIGHVVLYAILGLSVAWPVAETRCGYRKLVSALVTIAVCVFFGIAIEIEQAWTGRSASWSDIMANAIGSFIGTLAFCHCGAKAWHCRTQAGR